MTPTTPATGRPARRCCRRNIVGDHDGSRQPLERRRANGPAGKGAISAQQLLYTIIAAAPKIDSLQLQIAGMPVTSLWGTPLAGHDRARTAWQVLGHVWITSPLENATVASSVDISGEASVFEGDRHLADSCSNGGVLKQGVDARRSVRPTAAPGA